MQKKILWPFILLLIVFVVYVGLELFYFSPINTALKVDSIKISDELYDQMLGELKDITLTNKYFVDAIILSETAIEIGLDKDLRLYDTNISFDKRLALTEDLRRYYRELNEVDEKEMMDIYTERHPLYYEYIAIDTDKPITDFFDKDLSKLKVSKGTVEDLHDLNIVNVGVNKWYELPKKDDYNRYIYVSKELPQEVSFEDTKLEIENEIREMFSKRTIEQLLEQNYLKHTIDYYREAIEN